MEEAGSLVALAVGLLFWVYWGGAQILARPEQVRCSGRQDGLFFAACLYVLVVPFLLLLGCIFVPLLILTGYFGWAALISAWRSQQTERRALQESRPAPRLQFRLTDLFTVVAYFAVILTGYTLFIQGDEGNEEKILHLAAWFLPVCFFGLLAAADILSRIPAEQADLNRSWRILAVLLWFSVTLGIGGLMSWLMWRRALFLLDMEDWRSKQQADQQARAVQESVSAGEPDAPHLPPPAAP